MIKSIEILRASLNDLNPYLAQFSQDEAGPKDLLRKTLKAAIIKSYEFLLVVVDAKETDAFFYIPALRGICEDYITLRFISSQLGTDAERALMCNFSEELYSSVQVQWSFFEKNHPSQRLFYDVHASTISTENRDELRNIVKDHGLKPANAHAGLPSVRKMADKSGLLELYEYVYHATSKAVHFSPGVLLRMGWGDLPDIKFSTKNFGEYYKDFAIFYGSYLFVLLGKWLVDTATLDTCIMDSLSKIETFFSQQNRWPELVTFEEMGIGALSRHLFHNSPESAQAKKLL